LRLRAFFSDIHGDVEFASTDWSALTIARDRLRDAGGDAFARLVEGYRPAMVFFVRSHFRKARQDAEEIVQQFILEKLIERNLFAVADRSRGKFRSLLVTTLNHFVIDEIRRSGSRPFLTADTGVGLATVNSIDPFDLAWAESIVAEAIARTSKELADNGRCEYWTLFYEKVVRPAYSDVGSTAYATLSGQLGFDSPRSAINALVTAKRHFERVIESILIAQGSEDVSEQVGELLRILERRATSKR
jgi:DNA-directed RNA polymerase specialized sigma24 family protein